MTRKCKYCDKEFKANRDWQKFCSREHQKAYWKRVYLDKKSLHERLEALEKKLENENIQK